MQIKQLIHLSIPCDEIISLIQNLNHNKATASDGVSGQMLYVITSTYPDMWKLVNVTPIFKKGDKQLIKSYRPTSLRPICGKMLEKSCFKNLYSYLNATSTSVKPSK